ncbi:RHS repeat-associated core domain-containing protein, partial [Leptospira santarosai]
EAGALAYYLTDQVDSVSHVLDDEGNTLSQIQYQPYGETFVQRGDLNFSPKYNSQELDRESGFYFYNARYYDPGIARFTSADTIIDGEFDTQGWNRFSYVKGNPIGAKDPTGHLGEEQLVDKVAKVPLNKVLEEATKKTSEKAAENSGKVFSKIAGKATGVFGFLIPSELDAPTSRDKKQSNDKPIYRWGNDSNTNLTPREKDTNGLSFSTVRPENKKYVSTTMGAVNTTGKLVAIQDSATHVSVKPADKSKMPEWIQSRANTEANPHDLTKTLKAIVTKNGSK